MSKDYFLKIVLCISAVCFSACGSDDDNGLTPVIEDKNGGAGTEVAADTTAADTGANAVSLFNTCWKLEGFGTVGADGAERVEAFDDSSPWPDDDGISRFTILFLDDRSWIGMSSSNELYGRYSCQDDGLELATFGGTKVGETPDGGKYCEALRLVKHYKLDGDKLRLFYDGQKSYLLFHAL